MSNPYSSTNATLMYPLNYLVSQMVPVGPSGQQIPVILPAPTGPTGPTGPVNYCAQFSVPCDQPEPFASWIDVITAAQSLELAIHAKNIRQLKSNLSDVVQYLGYAKDYFTTAGNQNMVSWIAKIIDQFDTFGAETTVLRKRDLKQFQEQKLYAAMGILSALSRAIRAQ